MSRGRAGGKKAENAAVDDADKNMPIESSGGVDVIPQKNAAHSSVAQDEGADNAADTDVHRDDIQPAADELGPGTKPKKGPGGLLSCNRCISSNPQSLTSSIGCACSDRDADGGLPCEIHQQASLQGPRQMLHQRGDGRSHLHRRKR